MNAPPAARASTVPSLAPVRDRASRQRPRPARSAPTPPESLWATFRNDQYALRLKWGVLVLLMLAAALLELPL